MPPKFKRHLDEEQRVHLLGDEDSGDDDIAHGNRPAFGRKKHGVTGDDNISRVQGQIGQVMGVMQSNISKVLDRGERLEDLQDKTDDLAAGALNFHKSSTQLRKKMWWKQCKMRLILVAIILIIVGVIIIPIIIKNRNDSGSSDSSISGGTLGADPVSMS